MSIKHRKTSAKADGADTSLVRPSEWNDDHNAPTFVALFIAPGAPLIWPDQPAALTELFASTHNRTKVDLSYASQLRLVARVVIAGASGAELRAQYSTDETTWNYLDGAAGPAVVLASTGQKTSAWGTIPAGALGDVFVRLVGINGDGAADPELGLIQLQVR